jgi:hypothetical protein
MSINIKPTQWNVSLAQIDPAWQWFFRACPRLLLPLWSPTSPVRSSDRWRHSGTLQSGTMVAPTWALLSQGYSLRFRPTPSAGSKTGSGILFEPHPALDISVAITILAGIRNTGGTDWNPDAAAGRIISMGNGSTGDHWALMMGTGTGNLLTLRISGSDMTAADGAGGLAKNGQWHHVAGTYVSGRKALYVGGVQVTSTTAQTGTINTGQAVRIGRNSTTDDRRSYWGDLLYCYVLAAELTGAEIVQISRDPFGPFRQRPPNNDYPHARVARTKVAVTRKRIRR